MTHSDAVIDRNGVEFFRHAAGSFNLIGNQLAQIAQMNVSRHELGERVNDGDNRFAEIRVSHSCCAPQGTGTGHITAMSSSGGTVLRHALFTPVWINKRARPGARNCLSYGFT